MSLIIRRAARAAVAVGVTAAVVVGGGSAASAKSHSWEKAPADSYVATVPTTDLTTDSVSESGLSTTASHSWT